MAASQARFQLFSILRIAEPPQAVEVGEPPQGLQPARRLTATVAPDAFALATLPGRSPSCPPVDRSGVSCFISACGRPV